MRISIQETALALLALGCPPLPVAPKQDPRLPGCHHQTFLTTRFNGVDPKKPEIQGAYCRISCTKVGDFQAHVKGDYCRLDENLQPIARFTGKNPSYLERCGKPHIIHHKEYQNRLPTEAELEKWFANPANGIGTLGGHNGVDWLDFDAKNYASQEECDRDVERIRQLIGVTWVERTGSGGYRIAVKPNQIPTFTNFTTDPNAENHIGEALGEGRFTVLAPSIHPNGKNYQRVEFAPPAKIESLESIEIYPTKDEKSNQARREKRQKSDIRSVASSPQDKPWDIRNFAEYMEGCHIDGDYYECRCPVHSGNSDNSLSIHIDTGAFWCWSGCDTKEIYRRAKETAIAGGYQLPKRGAGFGTGPNLCDRDRYIGKRLLRFRSSYWEGLQKDFTLTETEQRKIFYYKGYAPFFELSERTILLRGWLGAGKTEAVLRSLLTYRDKQILWLTGRNGLLRQTGKRAEDLGFSDIYHYQDDPAHYREMLRTGQPGIYTLCPDSLKDYATKNAKWKDTIVVIDEFSGVRREVLKKSATVLEFERLLTECAHLIAVDAFLSDVDVRVISMYRSGGRLIFDQIFQKSKTPIFWLETRNKDGEISLSHDGIIYPLLKIWVEQGKSIAIPADNKLQAKSVQDCLESLGYHGTLCSSETIESNRSLLKDPDSVVSKLKFFVYTPTAQSGLDCQVTFDCGLALYSGIISPIDFLQMIGRCRQCKEWYVSAPRRALDPTCSVPSLVSKKVKQWADKLKDTFNDLGVNSDKTTGWGVWQSLTHEVEQAFHSEYLYCLLTEFFETVETLEIERDRTLWQKEVIRIKAQELVLTLNGDLENGLRLLREQKAPSTDAEVWDIALAAQHQKYPTVWKALIAQYRSGVEQDEVLKLAKLFRGKRLEHLRHWVQATGPETGQDLAELYHLVKTHFTSYTSVRWKALQNHALFQELKLDQLAAASKKEKAIAHETHFRYDSPVVIQLWQEFQQKPKLQKLFPTVETPYQFWQTLKKSLSFFGYQSAAQNIRVKTPGELHPNGKDKKGNQRLSESESRHFNGWRPMAESGSQFFQQNFILIVEAISERLKWERERRRREQERALAPPIAA
ncbi:MAG: bifunctional DNA primase/polymerase [Leptolyngbyaceae cyanobacterium bins.302]|nr:bifunctional DNA primase/polymerase [Leptolyngbyaceae cyanobacterium bins.302]